MQLFLAKDGKQTGPFSEEQVMSMLAGGAVSSSDLCWHEGLSTWLPLSQVVTCASAAPPPIPTISIQPGVPMSPSGRHPGFWLRFVAFIIDMIICNVGGFLLGLLFGILMVSQGVKDQDVLGGLGMMLGIVLQWLYYTLMESSSKQATLGKMACGFFVTDLEGKRISFGKACGRYFGMIVSALILGIGFLMCAWTERKQCLHDTMAGCLMFKK